MHAARKLILASGSPRKELLTALGLYLMCVSQMFLKMIGRTQSKDLVLNNAILKAESVMPKFANALVVGSDTTVSLEGTIFSKPSNLDSGGDASKLSGRWHQVYTAVSCVGWRIHVEIFMKSLTFVLKN